MSLKIMNVMQLKNKNVQNLGHSFCRNGFYLWLDGSFQFQNCVQIFMKHATL
jgi:hypothetical protein